VRNFAIALIVYLVFASQILAGESGSFLTSTKLISQCETRNPTCETYIMAVFDAARAIQKNTQREEGKGTFFVLCDASRQPDVPTVIEQMLIRAKRYPEELKLDSAVFVIQAINVQFACK
jgi:hypothetical protein